MEKNIIKMGLSPEAMRQMVELMAPGSEVYQKKANECETLKARVTSLEVQVAMLEGQLNKERSEKERWIQDTLLYRDIASRNNAVLQLIILNAKRLQEVMLKIREITIIGVLRAVLRDALDNPNDIEQQKLVDRTTAFPEPQAIEVRNEFADGSCRFEMGSSLNGNVVINPDK